MPIVEQVEDLSHAIGVLAENPDVLVCYARLGQGEALEHLRRRMYRERAFVQAFRRVSGLEVEEEGLLSDLGMELSGEFREQANRTTLSLRSFNALAFANGKKLTVPSRFEGGELGLVAAQGDWRNTVSGERHRDDRNAVCTANFYLEGKGVRFRIPSPSLSISFHSPVMTVHRGLAHPLCLEKGESLAVEHERQANDKRSNVIFCYVPSGFFFS